MLKLHQPVKPREWRCVGFLTEWLEFSSGNSVVCQLQLSAIFEGNSRFGGKTVQVEDILIYFYLPDSH